MSVGVVAMRHNGLPVPTVFDTQEKSAVRESLIRWKTVRFSIEDRLIALSVFHAGSLRQRKVRKIFQPCKTALENSCADVSSMNIPFGLPLYRLMKQGESINTAQKYSSILKYTDNQIIQQKGFHMAMRDSCVIPRIPLAFLLGFAYFCRMIIS